MSEDEIAGYSDRLERGVLSRDEMRHIIAEVRRLQAECDLANIEAWNRAGWAEIAEECSKVLGNKPFPPMFLPEAMRKMKARIAELQATANAKTFEIIECEYRAGYRAGLLRAAEICDKYGGSDTADVRLAGREIRAEDEQSKSPAAG